MSYKAPNLDPEKHMFFGRNGGVSTGKYSSLNINLPSFDAPENMLQNLEIIAQNFGLHKENLAIAHQGVTNHAIYVDKPMLREIKADGMVTDKEDLILGIGTADCAPVLFADGENKIIGAAHAGWRGAVRGIIKNTVKLMLEKGAKLENIKAAVGPCLQRQNFECRDDMYAEFIETDPSYSKYFHKLNSHQYLFDAQTFVFDRIRDTGIKNISVSNIDTYREEEEYFSYRRDTHLGINQDVCAHLSAIRI